MHGEKLNFFILSTFSIFPSNFPKTKLEVKTTKSSTVWFFRNLQIIHIILLHFQTILPSHKNSWKENTVSTTLFYKRFLSSSSSSNSSSSWKSLDSRPIFLPFTAYFYFIDWFIVNDKKYAFHLPKSKAWDQIRPKHASEFPS